MDSIVSLDELLRQEIAYGNSYRGLGGRHVQTSDDSRPTAVEDAPSTVRAFLKTLPRAEAKRVGRAYVCLRRANLPARPLSLYHALATDRQVGPERAIEIVAAHPWPSEEAEVRAVATRLVAEERAKKRLAELGRKVARGAGRIEPDRVEDAVQRFHGLLDEVAATLPRSEGGPGEGLRTLEELLDSVGSQHERIAVVERIAWRGRLTVLAGREKLGKSTLAGAAVAAASQGKPFLGATPPGPHRVLYHSLEEHSEELAGRLVRFGARRDSIYVREGLSADPIRVLQEDAEQVRPGLVVVDSLAALTQHRGLESGSASQWTRTMTTLLDVARNPASQPAVLLLHHARKSDGRYRDSSAIGASADMILEMRPSDGGPNQRTITASGRWYQEDLTVELVEPENSRPSYRVAGGAASLEDELVNFVSWNPGASTRRIRKGVQGRSQDITEHLRRLESAGKLENRSEPGEQGDRWHVVGQSQE